SSSLRPSKMARYASGYRGLRALRRPDQDAARGAANSSEGVAVTAPSEARPRGTRLPRVARRRQLLAAAQQVFVERGYHAAAMDEIAERAGVSKPVLYQHFPGKLELYLALLDASCDTVMAAVRKALASTDDNKERVTATMEAFYTYVSGERAAFRLVFE